MKNKKLTKLTDSLPGIPIKVRAFTNFSAHISAQLKELEQKYGSGNGNADLVKAVRPKKG